MRDALPTATAPTALPLQAPVLQILPASLPLSQQPPPLALQRMLSNIANGRNRLPVLWRRQVLTAPSGLLVRSWSTCDAAWPNQKQWPPSQLPLLPQRHCPRRSHLQDRQAGPRADMRHIFPANPSHAASRTKCISAQFPKSDKMWRGWGVQTKWNLGGEHVAAVG